MNLALAEKPDEAHTAAEEAGRLAASLPYPAVRAAALQAAGACAADPEAGAASLAEARAVFEGLERPIDAAWCDLLTAHIAAEESPGLAREALDRAAAAFERLGVPHMAQRARALLPVT